jgi:putative flippase GtrA
MTDTVSYKTEWMKYESGFCESKLFGESNPEYLSGCSALVIIFFGLLGLQKMPLPISIWQFIFSFITMNGIGSMVFHLTKQHGWGLIDGITMIIAFHLASYHCYNILGYKYFVIKNNTQLETINTSTDPDPEDNGKAKRFLIFSAIGCLVHVFSLCLCIGLNGYKSSTDYASIVCGLSLCIQFYIGIKWLYRNNKIDPDFILMRRYLIRSIIGALVMASVWIVGEGLCDKYEWIKYIPHHMLWHIIMSWSLYGIGMSLLFIDATNLGLQPYFKSDKWYYVIIPILKLKKNKVNAIIPAMLSEDFTAFQILEN